MSETLEVVPTYSLADYVECSQEQADELIVAHLSSIGRYMDAGHWNSIRSVDFELQGHWLVAMALRTSDPTPWLAELATIRDRLLEAMEYESVHGVDSLIKPDHPFSLYLEKVRDRLRKASKRGGRFCSPTPWDKWSRMLDWRTFNFTDAAGSGLRPGTPPPEVHVKREGEPRQQGKRDIPQPPPDFWVKLSKSEWCIPVYDVNDVVRLVLCPGTPVQ